MRLAPEGNIIIYQKVGKNNCNNLTFNFIIGTKAQFIKTIPVINEFLKSGKKVKLYDLKQHSETTSDLRKKIIGKYIYINCLKIKLI